MQSTQDIQVSIVHHKRNQNQFWCISSYKEVTALWHLTSQSAQPFIRGCSLRCICLQEQSYRAGMLGNERKTIKTSPFAERQLANI